MKPFRNSILILALTALVSASASADVQFKGFSDSDMAFLGTYLQLLLQNLKVPGGKRVHGDIALRDDNGEKVGGFAGSMDPADPLYRLFTQKKIVIQLDDFKNWTKAIQERQKQSGGETIPPDQLNDLVQNSDVLSLDYPPHGPKQEHLIIFNSRQYKGGVGRADLATVLSSLVDQLYGQTYTRLLDPRFQGKKDTFALNMQMHVAGYDRTIPTLEKVAALLAEKGGLLASAAERLRKGFIPHFKKERAFYQSQLKGKGNRRGNDPNNDHFLHADSPSNARWEISPFPPNVYSLIGS